MRNEAVQKGRRLERAIQEKGMLSVMFWGAGTKYWSI
jgi:hypothetical protein